MEKSCGRVRGRAQEGLRGLFAKMLRRREPGAGEGDKKDMSAETGSYILECMRGLGDDWYDEGLW